jgi:phospholipase C
MDRFLVHSCNDPVLGANSTLGYYDGNTVAALWNYAQHFALSDNSYGTTFGPSTPGLLNFVAGNTFAGTIQNGLSGKGFIARAAMSGSVIGDADPANDICSSKTRTQILMSGSNIGDLLNTPGITWGAFIGGCGDTTCSQAHDNVGGVSERDYIPHHAFFHYWLSTQNPQHLPPSKPEKIGRTDQANHQYDLSWSARAGCSSIRRPDRSKGQTSTEIRPPTQPGRLKEALAVLLRPRPADGCA